MSHAQRAASIVSAVLVFLVLGCQYFQLPEHLQSEAVIDNPNRTVSDAIVFLNAEPAGRISDIGYAVTDSLMGPDTRAVDKRLSEIAKQRESEGVYHADANEVAANVNLIADPELSVWAFAKLYKGIDNAAGVVYIPRNNKGKEQGEPVKPDPLTLVVHTVIPGGRHDLRRNLSSYDPDFKYSYDMQVEYALSAEQLKGTRMWEDSFEISADERFFINEKQGPEADHGPTYSRVKQRPIAEDQAKDELSRLPTLSDRKLIIVSEKASYGKLLWVMALLDETRSKYRIVVRPSNYAKE